MSGVALVLVSVLVYIGLYLLYLLFVLEFFDISVLLILPMSVLNVLFATIASA